jgi:hypothetical protein
LFLCRGVWKKTCYENKSHHCVFEKSKENNKFFSQKIKKNPSYSKPLCKETTDLKEGQNPASEAHSHAVPGAQKIEYLQNLYSVVF